MWSHWTGDGGREGKVSGNGAAEQSSFDAVSITQKLEENSSLDDKRYQTCQERFQALEQEVVRLRGEIVKTRVLIGERELRFEEYLRRLRGISNAFVEGIDELVREW